MKGQKCQIRNIYRGPMSTIKETFFCVSCFCPIVIKMGWLERYLVTNVGFHRRSHFSCIFGMIPYGVICLMALSVI